MNHQYKWPQNFRENGDHLVMQVRFLRLQLQFELHFTVASRQILRCETLILPQVVVITEQNRYVIPSKQATYFKRKETKKRKEDTEKRTEREES